MTVLWKVSDSFSPDDGNRVLSGDERKANAKYLHMRIVHDSIAGWVAVGFNPNAA